MRTRLTAAISVAVLLAGFGALPAGAQDDEGIEKQTDNLTLVDHIHYQLGTDMQFQRREGPHLLDGDMTEGTRDYLFAGADASNASDFDVPDDGVGIHVFDVTDPTNIESVVGIRCLGYHADVAVYEDVLVHAIDSAPSNEGCEPRERWDPDQVDVRGHEGLRIFDVSDPAQPTVARFIAEDELDGAGVHNITVVPWAGLLYIASSDLLPGETGFRFGYVDLTDPEFPVTMIPMHEITPNATGGCHDIGLDPDRELAFCAAVEQTFVWDIADPTAPQHVSTIVNPAINIHHGARLAPDGETLVVNDELGGAAAAFGCLGTGGDLGAVGALWFYDVSDPSSPVPMGSFSTQELNPPKNPCTSHFYNFIPGTELLVVGWYKSGLIVVDYSDRSAPSEHAGFLPEGGNYWAAYYWRGALYGSSFEMAEDMAGGGGLWVLTLDEVGDVAPAPQDEGTSWARWTPPETDEVAVDVEAPGDEDAAPTMPTTGGGATAALAALLALAAATGLARRGR